MSPADDFDTFYQAVNDGRSAFPWQRRLAAQVAQDGIWPSEIGVPTGLGKTTCLDIAVWALARQANGPAAERTAPTRTWYVVNRRLLVDAAYEHGCRLADLLRDPLQLKQQDHVDAHHIDSVVRVSESLSRLVATGLDTGPLHVHRLRGGAELGVRPPDPSHPSLIFATVAMYGSRLLFRGYGSSTSMRPVDAALAGIDSLVLLDEAHLARPLKTAMSTLAQCDLGDPATLVELHRSRPQLAAMTATGEAAEDRFGLDAEDLSNPVVQQRVNACKPTTLRESKRKRLARDLASAMTELITESELAGCGGVIFVNSPSEARKTFDELVKLGKKRTAPAMDALLLTGRARDREADRTRRTLLDPVDGAPSDRARDRGRERHLVVVSTQTLEVGADLDFDLLVTETAGVRALVQRFGRLNRLGLTHCSKAIIYHPADAKPEQSIYGEEIDEVWEHLQSLEPGEAGALDMSPNNISTVFGPPQDSANRVAEMLPALLWEKAKTSCPPVGETPVDLFYAGFEADGARVSVAWRVEIPPDGQQFFRPVREHESVELPLTELTRTLSPLGHDPVARLASDRVSIERVPLTALRAGEQVILPCDLGLHDEFGWSPTTTLPVVDVSMIEDRRPYLPVTTSALEFLWPSGVPAAVRDAAKALEDLDLDSDDVDVDEVDATLVAAFRSALSEDAATPYDGTELGALRALTHVERVVADGDVRTYLTADQQRKGFAHVPIAADALDELCFSPGHDLLTSHQTDAGELARKIAVRVGLPAEMVDDVATAASLHDAGKQDPRFQAWLDPRGTHDAALAKSKSAISRREAARVASGWPRGGRHEVLSEAMLAKLVAERGSASGVTELVRHLVITHHGHGRPSFPAVSDPNPPRFVGEVSGQRVDVLGDVSLQPWEQPQRFRRLCECHGYWGLALLEAIVRQADHLVSQVAEVI